MKKYSTTFAAESLPMLITYAEQTSAGTIAVILEDLRQKEFDIC